MMQRQRKNLSILIMAFVLLFAIALGGCEGGGECQGCDNDMDCDEGLTCRRFIDQFGIEHFRCADDGTETCTIRTN